MARIRRLRRDTVQSPLETYLREINEVALLNADEEKMLARAIAQGDNAARERMVRANLRLVVNIARGYVGKGLALQDLDRGVGTSASAPGGAGVRPGGSGRGSARTRWRATWIKQSTQALVNTAKLIRIPAHYDGRAALQAQAMRRPTCRTEARGGRRRSRRSAHALEVPKKKLAIVKKAIKVYNLVLCRSDQPENGWSLGEMLMDERTTCLDVEDGRAPTTSSW